MLRDMILKNRKGTFGEILTDYDFDSWKLNYERNNERSIEFTVYKTSMNRDLFDLLLNEMLLEWEGQNYVVKSTSIKYDGLNVMNEITAKHIFMEFQNHYIQKNLEDEELNNEETADEDNKPTMTLEQYLDFGFKGNKIGFTYEIVGDFDQRVAVDELGNKMEWSF